MKMALLVKVILGTTIVYVLQIPVKISHCGVFRQSFVPTICKNRKKSNINVK